MFSLAGALRPELELGSFSSQKNAAPPPNQTVANSSTRLSARLRQLDDIQRLESLVGLGDLKFDAVALVECLEAFSPDDGKVNENILSTLILRNEAKALFIIEPFDDPVSHLRVP
jgi:hypothetical protein